jgi:hypothetical protein
MDETKRDLAYIILEFLLVIVNILVIFLVFQFVDIVLEGFAGKVINGTRNDLPESTA